MKFGIIRSMLRAGMGAAALVTFTSCKAPQPQITEESEPPAPATPAPVATPAPAPPLAAATPVPDPLAPPGIYFLLQKASITTDEGIVGLKPGQGLRQVSPGTYEVNGRTVQLRDDQVTNNLRIARQFAAADVATQAALRQAIQPKTTPDARTSNLAATPAPPAPKRPAAPQGGTASSGPRLGAGTGAADPETSNRKNVRVDSGGRQYWKDSRGSIRYDF